MHNKKNIILTFDYEPFLGKKSGTSQKCIILPTTELNIILNKHKAKAIFFVDVLYVKHLKSNIELLKNYEEIIIQLKKLYENGHYIFPHIHPHWLDANYIKNEKQFDLSNLSRYSLSNCSETVVEKLFSESIFFLENIGITYDKWGYRAGGWCMQPFQLYLNVFKKNNIVFDFSVLPGYKNENKTQYFDYSMVKNNKPYNFSKIIEESNAEGEFKEYPISTIVFNPLIIFLDKIIKKYLWKTGDKGFGDGQSAQTAALQSTTNNMEMITIDSFNVVKLKPYLHFLKTNSYMHWISHPKMFTRHGLKTLDTFLHSAKNKYDIEFDFKKIEF